MGGTVCKAEIETQMQRTNVWTPWWESGGGGGGGMNWEIGIDMYTLICIKQITNKKKKVRVKSFAKNKSNENELSTVFYLNCI